jgi:cytoskeleton protein RodZ
VAASAGAQLRAYRENAQLTIDDVAHQLKLARRQVIAIENDELDALPGPTFVRGFIRNYARLLRVDAGPLLEASNLTPPASAQIDRIAPTMGELPADNASSVSWTRWFIPAGLVLVLVAGIAFYEFGDVSSGTRKARKESSEAVVATPTTGPDAAANAPSGNEPAQGTAPGAAGSDATVAAGTPGDAKAAASPAVQAPQQSAAGEAGRVDLMFSGPSWVEIRDGRGEILVSRTLAGNSPQSFSGVLPLSLKIGHASIVRLQFNGTPVDLAPWTQREIARLTLPLPRQ